jgi:hypothetical protein
MLCGGRPPVSEPLDDVLVIGVYLADQPNLVPAIVQELGHSRRFRVTQRWMAVGDKPLPRHVQRVTVGSHPTMAPRAAFLNELVRAEDSGQFEFVVVCDDDIALPSGFLDEYLTRVRQYDFALAQPARTPDSHIDHWFVRQLAGIQARWTRFVEIGPLVSIRRDAATLVLPFDERAPMGWGLDFMWPSLLERHGLRMGIVDATPVQHTLRKPVSNYARERESRTMAEYLRTHPHLSQEEAFRIIESYA